MRQGSTLSYLFADQLGSTSVVANSSGSKTAEVRYKAWGEDRYTSGTVPSGYRYTGQRVDAMLGLYFYGARWYDPSLGRFLSADTIVPSTGDPQAWDRYAYVDNNPVVNVDPTGHMLDQGGGAASMGDDWWKKRQEKLRLPIINHNDHRVEKGDSSDKWELGLRTAGQVYDTAAFVTNALYMIPADAIMLANPASIPAVEGFYQFYSYIPNSLSTVGTISWLAHDFVTKDNVFSITPTPKGSRFSLTLSQDSIVSATATALGWTVAKDINVATIIDSSTVMYDMFRSPTAKKSGLSIPTLIRPTFELDPIGGFSMY
jgi:RHS repeat-associated protein